MFKRLVVEEEIRFVCRNPFLFEVTLRPFPATSAIPQWYRDIPPYFEVTTDSYSREGTRVVRTETRLITLSDGVDTATNATVKKCTPLLDGLTTGYMLPLWEDVMVKQTPDNEPVLTWMSRKGPNDWIPFSRHGNPSVEQIPNPPGYSPIVYKFHNPWHVYTPKGYSCLFVEPFGYKDAVFKPVPGVIDTDKFTSDIIIPGWIKDGFDGVIEKGTPLVQVIPFKRSNWKSSFSYLPAGQIEINDTKGFFSVLKHHYLNNVWQKKSYK